MVKLTINGTPVEVQEGTTILEAAKSAGISIPTLCYLKGINKLGGCRMCLVEVKGMRGLGTSCTLPVSEGMEVQTNTQKVRDARKSTLELILSDHDQNCLACRRSNNCELRTLATDLGIKHVDYIPNTHKAVMDEMSPSIVRDNKKCILCRRCVAVCNDIQKVNAIGMQNRGYNTEVSSPFSKSLGETKCINCGQCIAACPVGALYEKDAVQAVWAAIADPTKHVVIQAAPAVRAALGEEFGMPIGTNVTGKMAAAMRRLGVNKVFDTDFAADLTIMEEVHELIERIQHGGKLPLITSCSPGWIKFCEHNYHDLLGNLSSCKSPHEMLGVLIKTYYAKQAGIDPKDIFVVSVMPCTAKKFEVQRPEMKASGYQDVDVVLTTRELGRMIKEAGIDFKALPDEAFDDVLGDYTGAGVIFGATGGVMEAAVRTAVEILTGKSVDKVDYEVVRGNENVKVATLDVAGLKLKIAVAHGTGAARDLLERVRAGEEFHFIEIMGCPGGCVTGGGQPIVNAKTRMDCDPYSLRAKALYDEDKAHKLRKSHENPSVQKLYKEFLGEPGSHKAHELLHTHYTAR